MGYCMSAPLFWATRPAHQNAAWQQQLAALGQTVAVPLLDIVPVTDTRGCQAIKNHVQNLDHYQQVIFVSQNAVSHAFEWFNNYWPQLPVGIHYFAVGAKTAAMARQHGIDVSECGDAMNSEGLLALPALKAVQGQKVLICRGRGGRPKLAEVLEERGAQVLYCELYDRALPPKAIADCAHYLPLATQHIVPIFSGETLANFVTALPATLNRNVIHLIVPAQHVAQEAHAAGFNAVRVAQNASEAAMLATIRQFL